MDRTFLKHLAPRHLRKAILNYRHSIQLRDYHVLLNQLLATNPVSASKRDAEVVSRIGKLSPHRRPISRVPNVLCFGAQHWEQNGFWPSLGRISCLEIYDYASRFEDLKAHYPMSAIRESLAREFTETVDRLDRSDPLEIVFFYAASHFISLDLIGSLKERGIWTVLMGLDDKHQFQVVRGGDVVAGQCEIARLVDLYWTSWPGGVDLFFETGARPWYAPLGADPAYYYPIPKERTDQIAFVGQRYGRREHLVEYLRRAGFNVLAFGQGWPSGRLNHLQVLELYNSAMAVLGVGDVATLPEVQHIKARDFEVPMCAALYLTTFNPELTSFFDIGKDILCYSSFEECAEVLWNIRNNPDRAERIRQAGYRRAVVEHTWEHRFRALLAVLSRASE